MVKLEVAITQTSLAGQKLNSLAIKFIGMLQISLVHSRIWKIGAIGLSFVQKDLEVVKSIAQILLGVHQNQIGSAKVAAAITAVGTLKFSLARHPQILILLKVVDQRYLIHLLDLIQRVMSVATTVRILESVD